MPGEAWQKMLTRTARSDCIHEIDRDVDCHFLSVVRPCLIGHRCFGFRLRSGPMRVFWRDCRRYCCRTLTQAEAAWLCARVPPPPTRSRRW